MKNNFPKRELIDSKVILAYIPHGVNPDIYRKIEETDEEYQEIVQLRDKLYGNGDVKFSVFYNSRNLRRKSPGDVVLAFCEFVKLLPKDKQDSVRLVMHTQPVDDNGTDLPRIVEDLFPEYRDLVIFSSERVEPKILNRIYNCVDVVISMSSNEGFGIGTLEGMMAEKMIIANVTGGLQDQMGFVNDNGEYLDEDKEFNANWGSNHTARYKVCGSWAIPLFPTNLSLNGSPPTPYIFDDRCSFVDAANAIYKCYSMTVEERIANGKAGREYALSQAFNSSAMGNRFIEGITHVLDTWTPRKRFGIFKV